MEVVGLHFKDGRRSHDLALVVVWSKVVWSAVMMLQRRASFVRTDGRNDDQSSSFYSGYDDNRIFTLLSLKIKYVLIAKLDWYATLLY